MNILHVITSLDPMIGGPPIVAMRLAAGQARLGHQVGILTYSAASRDAAVRDELNRIPDAARLTIHSLPEPGRTEKLLGTQAQKACEQLFPHADIIHFHGVWNTMIRIGMGVSARLRKPSILSAHCNLNRWSLAQGRWKKRLALAWFYRARLNKLGALHALNEHERRCMTELNLKTPIHVIPNAIDPEEMEPVTADQFRDQFPALKDKRLVLFLGRLHHQKGPDILIRAFTEARKLSVTPIHLVLAGPDYGMGSQLQELIQQLGLDEHVTLAGMLYGPMKISALKACDLFCLPSREEGFSIAILEALACGKPVVISDACHFPEVAESGVGFVTTLDPRQIGARIGQLLADPAPASAMSLRSAAFVKNRYVWPVVAEQYIQAYEHIRREAEDRESDQGLVVKARSSD